MTIITLVLTFSAVALAFLSYMKILYVSKRKIKIAELHVANATNGDTKLVKTEKEYAQPPGPRIVWPVLGNLNELGKYAAPSIAFTELAAKYGDIYSLTLGSSRCVVVNNLDLIREVLNQNGKYFGARPNFIRFHQLFGGDRSNCKYTFSYSFLVA